MNHHTCPECQGPPSRRSKTARRAMPLLAAGVVGAVLPLAGHFDAQAGPASDAAKPAFSGYSTSGQAEPIRMEIYEPTIPIPATPQAELDLGYTTVEADSSSSHSRASEVWPGDAVGEGFTTIAGALGLPLPDSVTAGGYPIQVNAAYPAGPAAQANQPAPSQVMRTAAGQHDSSAEIAFSSDCSTSTTDPGGGGTTGGGLPIPGLPGLPTLPPLPGLPGVGGAKVATGNAAAADDGTSCMTPTEADAIVTAGSYNSVTRTNSGPKAVYTVSRASLNDVHLAGGLVNIGSITAMSKTSSNGKKGTPTGSASYGEGDVAGMPFSIGPNGVTSPSGGTAVPGLPSNAADALTALGFTFDVPKPVFKHDKAMGSSDVEALTVTIDTTKLRSKLNSIPFDTITGAIPDLPGQANMIKSALQAATHLAPRYVLHLGVANTKAATVQPLPIPPVSSTPTSSAPTSSAPPSSAAPAHNGGGGPVSPPGPGSEVPPPGSDGLPSGGPLSDTPPSTENPPLVSSPPVVSRLPKLFSIPGLLLFGGLAGGALLGSYARRLGIAALGGTSSCPHGLDSGLPDLRKA